MNHLFYLALINEWLGLPELASEHGQMVDHMMEIVNWFMVALGLGWSAFLVYVFWRFREKKNQRADYGGVKSHASHHVEIAVVMVEAILLLGFAFPLWKKRVAEYPTGDDVVKVRAVGEQFAWTMHYAGVDGLFGATNPRLITGSNRVGLVEEDPNARDDFMVVNELILPKGKPIIVDVTSKDVIHNLALHPMRIAQDAIPGSSAHMWFRPTKTGEWDIICGQLCGAGHTAMKATLTVNEANEFAEWFAGKSESSLQASIKREEKLGEQLSQFPKKSLAAVK